MATSDKFSLSEFLHLTQLNRHELLSLLENGELPVEIGPTREVLVNLSGILPETIARRPLRGRGHVPEQERFLYAEAIGSVLTGELDSIVQEALDLALSWFEKRSGGISPSDSESS